MTQSQKRSKAFAALYSNLFAKISGNIFPFLASVLIIRLLSVEDFGRFSLFLSFLSIFGGLSFGIHHVYQRYVASYAEKEEDIPRLVKLTFVTVAIRIGVFFGLLLILYIFTLLKILELSQFNFPYIFLAIITAAAVIFKTIFREGLLSAFLDHKFFNFFDNIITILKVLFIFLFRPTNIIEFVYLWLFLEIVRVLGLFLRFAACVRRNQSSSPHGEAKGLEYKRYFNYGKYFIFATVAAQILAFDIDNYFLSYFRSNEEVGLYSFATKIAFVLVGFAPANILFNFVTPVIIKDYEKHRDKNRIKDIMGTLFKLNIFVYTIIAIFLCVNLNFLIQAIFQTKYLSTIPYIFVLIGLSFLPVIKNTFEPVARGVEKSSVYLFTLITAVLNVIGNILLIPHIGITGALVSTGVAISLQSIIFVVFVHREIKFSFDRKFLMLMCVNILPIVVVGYLFQSYMRSVFNVIVLNVFLFTLLLLLFRINRCFTSEELDFINSFLPMKMLVF